MFSNILLITVLSIFLAAPASGSPPASDEIGVYERLGESVPPDLTFRDETGASVRLGDIIDKPTVLTLIYYKCSHICPQMLLGISELLAKSELIPGKDYRVITVSFDDTETPENARSLKLNYIKAINKPFPEDAWKFLTGDSENIRKLSEAVGIRYKKVMHGFVHPEVLIFLSPQGGITRYFHVATSSYGLGYPVIFSAVDFTGAITDASKGITGSGIKQTPLLCFPHEPEQQAKFFSMLKTFGTATLLLILALFVYLSFANKKPSGKRNKTDGE